MSYEDDRVDVYRIVSNKGYKSSTFERYGMAFQAKEVLKGESFNAEEVFRVVPA